MREFLYQLFWNRETQGARVNSAFRRGFALGFFVAIIIQSIAIKLS
jgi:hypothetical protein